VDTLVCNAGLWVPMDQKARTQDGLEIHAGVNHLGLLIDKVPLSRVVMVSSSLMNAGKLDFCSDDHFHKGRVPEAGSRSHVPTGYRDSKLMNALFTKELAVKRPELTVVSVCPGWCRSELGRHVPLSFAKKMVFSIIKFLFQRSSAEGAQNIIQAVVEKKEMLVNGATYRECLFAEEENWKLDSMESARLELWSRSEKLVSDVTKDQCS